MTSREALDELRNDISNRALMFSDEKIDIIEKDLEILELIKERLIHNIFGNIVFVDNLTERIDEDGNTIFIDEGKYKIMRWLDNDKQRSTK